ncbi:MAG: tetratricopeptide repeat protein [Betaproteobacteria bacterium]
MSCSPGRRSRTTDRGHSTEPDAKPPPATAQQWLTLARAASASGEPAAARDHLIDCLAQHPDCVEAYRELAALLEGLGFPVEARACVDLAAGHVPREFAAQFEHANALARQGFADQAIRHFQAAAALDPRQPAALNNLGLALAAQGRSEAAEQAFRDALELAPDMAEIHANLGDALRQRGRFEQAVQHFEAATCLKPDWPEAWNNLGVALRPLERSTEAMNAFEQAVALRPDFVEATYNFGNALAALGRNTEAGERYRRALAIDPNHAESAYSLGLLTSDVAAATTFHERALASRPDFAEALTALAFNQFRTCHWAPAEALAQRLRTWIEQRPDAAIAPLNVVQIFDDPALQQRAARQWVANRITPWLRGRAPLVDMAARVNRGERLRIGYLSADFRDHAVGRLIAGPLAAHDRERFHVTAYGSGPDDGSDVRRGIERAADVFREARSWSASDLATTIAADAIDILVDLSGHTEHTRSEALALRCAPLQLSYLGFPGTMGAPWIDFLLTDERLTPLAIRDRFDEAFAFVPGGYFVGPAATAATLPADRTTLGLPAEGMVFCCFNASYKIRSDVFASWMRILQRVPGSVLWLLQANDGAVARLCAAARNAGIAPERLCFAPAVAYEAHSARLSAADLFLDSWAYAAGATGGQTLAAGVPLLALAGAGYAARMSSALLGALGLDELVTTGPQDYEERAVALATDRGGLRELRGRVRRAVEDSPLFNADSGARRLEAVFERLWRWHADGRTPASALAP